MENPAGRIAVGLSGILGIGVFVVAWVGSGPGGSDSALSVYLQSIPIGSALLGLWLALRTELRGHLAALSAGLVSLSGALALWFAIRRFDVPAAPRTIESSFTQLVEACGVSLVVFGGLAMSRFLVIFPVPLVREDIERARGPGAGVTMLGISRIGLGKDKDVRRIAHLVQMLQSARFWNGAALLALVVAIVHLAATLVSPTAGNLLASLLLSVLVVMTPLAVLLPPLTAHRCNDEERRRLSWLMAGIVGALYSFLVYGFMLGAYVVFLAFGVELQILLGVGLALIPMPFFVFLAGLWASALFGGTLDPRVALRRTIIVSTLAAVCLFVFAATEAALSDALLERLGVPRGFGGWFAGGTAALAFRPAQNWIETRVARHLPRRTTTQSTSAR